MANRKPIIKTAPSTKVRIVSLKKPPVDSGQRDSQNGAILWGNDQSEPLRIVEVLRRSKTASLCIKQVKNYTYGNGFLDPRLANYKVNKEQTFDDLLLQVVAPVSLFSGLAINVKYTVRDGKAIPASLHVLPFENVRLKAPENEKDCIIDKVIFNPYFGTPEYDRQEDTEYYLFAPDKVLSQSAEMANMGLPYLGQVLYFGEESEYSRFYPTPYWWTDPTGTGGGKIDMENEHLLTRLLNKELDSGFLQNVILKMVGDPDAPIAEHEGFALEGKGYTTKAESFEEYLNNTFSGVDGDSMMVLWSELKEQFPELQEFPSRFNYEKLKDVEMTVAGRISAMFLVPPILAGIMGSGAISKDDIQNAVFLMWSTVREKQMIITSQLSKIVALIPELARVSLEIENYNPFPSEADVPQKVWDIMTLEEKRLWAKNNTKYID
jgi:hypothetical protein